MTDEAPERKVGVRTGAAGWGDQFPEPDAKEIVDRVMDPEHRTLPIKKEDTRGN